MIDKTKIPKLDPAGQIRHLQKKGVKFEIISAEVALDYLRHNNNYFKLRAFRKNYPKHPAGSKAGQYIDLDFALLQDLAIIDMQLRYVLIKMALDIEHFAKVQLLEADSLDDDDGYNIVDSYLSHLKTQDNANGSHYHDKLMSEIERNRNNDYCGGIITKFSGCFPIWAFVEIIPLGSFIDFYKYCSESFDDSRLADGYYLLRDIKSLRNAAAHNNCILTDLGRKTSTRKSNLAMLRSIDSIPKGIRKNQLANEKMRQITTLLYAHSVFVTSEGVHDRAAKELHMLVERLFYHADYYRKHENVLKSFEFIKKVVDILYPIA